jgi:RNA polymerase sigma factor (sigma-70 family)
MSHYVVAVFTEDENQSVDDLLAPYDESIEMEPYVDVTKEELIRSQRERMKNVFDHQYAEWKRDPQTYEKSANPAHIEYLQSLPERMKWADEQLYKDAIQSYDETEITPDGAILSRYNPDSKWDWYEIGGRWQGMYIKQNNGFDAVDAELIARFTSFMVEVVTSAKIDYIRRQRHWKWEMPMDELPEPRDELADIDRWQSAAPDDEFYFAEERISNALSSLPHLRRRILELSFIKELSAMEIAELLGCSVKFVHNERHAALKKLRNMLLQGDERDE